MIEHGAIISGTSALAAAVSSQRRRDKLEKVELLLQHGADIDEISLQLPWHVDPMFNWGNPETALHCAARWGWEDMVRLLIEKRANTEIVDSQGRAAEEILEKSVTVSILSLT